MSQFNEVMNKKAVALKYDENRNAAPVIVASGMGYLAEKIVEVANDNGVPVYEDNSLATVLTQLNLGAEIPEELYQAVVDIYAYFLKFVPKEPRDGALGEQDVSQGTEGDSEASPEG
ncbi:MAG: type III secretion protein [Lachnospiraceae bacterium]|nr:type III secretion protein [Lachnospiraceae bacterium]